MVEGTNPAAKPMDCSECESALNLLFLALGMTLPYLEACFKKCEPPSPDYFALPKVIQIADVALEAARKYRMRKEEGVTNGTPFDEDEKDG